MKVGATRIKRLKEKKSAGKIESPKKKRAKRVETNFFRSKTGLKR